MRNFVILSMLFGALLTPELAYCDGLKNCIVFANEGGSTFSLPIESHRIFKFDNGNLIVSDKDNPDKSKVISLSMFSRIYFDFQVQTSTSKISNTVEVLIYDSESNSLILHTSDPTKYIVSIFSPQGFLLNNFSFNSDGIRPLPVLNRGLYIAIASNGVDNKIIKFIKK